MKFLDFILRNISVVSIALGISVLAAYVTAIALAFPKEELELPGAGEPGEGAFGAVAYSYVSHGALKTRKVRTKERILRALGNRLYLTVGILVAILVLVFILVTPSLNSSIVTAELDFPQPQVSNPANDKLLLFIHGWSGDAQDTWKKFPGLVHDDPRFSGVDVLSIDYPTFMLRRNLNIAQLTRWINAHLDFGRTSKYKKVGIIAHSMGGLIARELIIQRKLSSPEEPILVLVEVSSPHLGANPAKLASALGLSKPLTDEMIKNSSFLITLQTDWQAVKNRPFTMCYTSPQDMVVSEESATSGCDDSLAYPQWGHRELVKPESQKDDRYLLPIGVISKRLLR